MQHHARRASQSSNRIRPRLWQTSHGDFMEFMGDLLAIVNGIMAWEIWRYSSMAISGTDWLEVPTICKAYVRGYTPKIWPTIWYSTSILGSWNSHWTHGNSWDLMRLIGANFISRWSYIFPKRSCVETWNNGWPSLLARSYQKYVSFNNQSNWLETSHQLKIF